MFLKNRDFIDLNGKLSEINKLMRLVSSYHTKKHYYMIIISYILNFKKISPIIILTIHISKLRIELDS